LPISDAQVPQADRLLRQASERGLRAEIAGPEQGSLGARIRAHRLVPYQAVIGAAEAVADEVALRLRDGRRLPALSAAHALARIGAMIDGHRADLWDDRGWPDASLGADHMFSGVSPGHRCGRAGGR
jgi:threonyl-tRNA synthetase